MHLVAESQRAFRPTRPDTSGLRNPLSRRSYPTRHFSRFDAFFMSWSALPRARKPFYRRGWVLTLVALFLIVSAGLAGFAWLTMREWKIKAQTFDYSRLITMESAS